MSEAKIADFADWQKRASNAFGQMFLDPALKSMLQAQSNFLVGVEVTMGEWLRHRREALVEAERIVTRMQTCPTLTEMWALQHEWIDHTWQRFAADAAQCQQAIMSLNGAGSQGVPAGADPASRQPERAAAMRSPPVTKPAAGTN
jgi:hypothetical protein